MYGKMLISVKIFLKCYLLQSEIEIGYIFCEGSG